MEHTVYFISGTESGPFRDKVVVYEADRGRLLSSPGMEISALVANFSLRCQ